MAGPNDIINQYAKQAYASTPDYAGSLAKGVELGSNLAARQAELDNRKQDLALRKAEHEFKKNDYLNAFLKQALSDDATPAQRRAYLKQYENIGKQIGKLQPDYSVDKDANLNLILQEDERRRVAATQLIAGSSSPEFINYVGQLSPSDINKLAMKDKEEKASLEKLKLTFQNKTVFQLEQDAAKRYASVLTKIEGEVPTELLMGAKSSDPVTRETSLRMLEAIAARQKGEKSQAKEEREEKKLKFAEENLEQRKKFTDAYVRNVNNQSGNINFDNQLARANHTKGLRKEWEDISKDARRVSRAKSSIYAALNDKSPSSRTAAFKEFQKLFDDSVIYPSEFAQQQEFLDLKNTASGYISALKGQGRYTEKDVLDMMRVAERMESFYSEAANNRRKSLDEHVDDFNKRVPKSDRIAKSAIFGPEKKEEKPKKGEVPKGPLLRSVSKAEFDTFIQSFIGRKDKYTSEEIKKAKSRLRELGYDAGGV